MASFATVEMSLPVHPSHRNFGPKMHQLRVEILARSGIAIGPHHTPDDVKIMAQQVDTWITAIAIDPSDITVDGPVPRESKTLRVFGAKVELAAKRIYERTHRLSTPEEIHQFRLGQIESERVCAQIEAEKPKNKTVREMGREVGESVGKALADHEAGGETIAVLTARLDALEAENKSLRQGGQSPLELKPAADTPGKPAGMKRTGEKENS